MEPGTVVGYVPDLGFVCRCHPCVNFGWDLPKIDHRPVKFIETGVDFVLFKMDKNFRPVGCWALFCW